MSQRVLRSSSVKNLEAAASNATKLPIFPAPLFPSNVQMEEYDDNFNPITPIVLGKNQCDDCGVTVSSGRLASHKRCHTCDEVLVCRFTNDKGEPCNKPCISNTTVRCEFSVNQKVADRCQIIENTEKTVFSKIIFYFYLKVADQCQIVFSPFLCCMLIIEPSTMPI